MWPHTRAFSIQIDAKCDAESKINKKNFPLRNLHWKIGRYLSTGKYVLKVEASRFVLVGLIYIPVRLSLLGIFESHKFIKRFVICIFQITVNSSFYKKRVIAMFRPASPPPSTLKDGSFQTFLSLSERRILFRYSFLFLSPLLCHRLFQFFEKYS